jgi:uncharacterized protein YdhG (YjbR/CyaY superfamily)
VNQQITNYIEKQKSPQKEICQKLRAIIFKTISDPKEEMKWGVPAFANGKFYIVALKDHVNFGYNDGSNKMKHVEIKTLDEIDARKIEKLIS